MIIPTKMWPLILLLGTHLSFAQEIPLYQSDFPPEEFAERRSHIFDQIGDQAVALLQSAPSVEGFSVCRQSNQFYYLCGVEVPHAYLLLDGRNRRTTLYLPHRDEGRERGEGKRLSAEDTDLVKELTGVESVMGVAVSLDNLIAVQQLHLDALSFVLANTRFGVERASFLVRELHHDSIGPARSGWQQCRSLADVDSVVG